MAAAEARLAVAAEDHMGEAGRTVAQAGAATVRAIHRTSNRSPALPRSSAPSPWPTIAASATPTRLWSRTVVMAAAYASRRRRKSLCGAPGTSQLGLMAYPYRDHVAPPPPRWMATNAPGPRPPFGSGGGFAFEALLSC